MENISRRDLLKLLALSSLALIDDNDDNGMDQVENLGVTQNDGKENNLFAKSPQTLWHIKVIVGGQEMCIPVGTIA